MKNFLKQNKLKLIVVAIYSILLLLGNQPSHYQDGMGNFPKSDPSKGESWGYDFNKGDYRYESSWPKDKTPPGQNTPTATQTIEVDMEIKDNKVKGTIVMPKGNEDVDVQDVIDYNGL